MESELDRFRQQIADHYSLEDLRLLAFDLQLNWDELAGPTLSAKIISLILYLHHQRRLPELVDKLKADRTHVDWPEADSVMRKLGPVATLTQAGLGPIDRFISLFTNRAQSDQESVELRNRRALLNQVRSFWIEGVLERSVHGAALLDLGKEEAPEAVDTPNPWEMIVEGPDISHWQLPPNGRIIDVYDQLEGDTERTLLILGAPGSGKTTTLLELARDTIDRALLQPTLPLPVIFNLSSWGEKQRPLAEWLVEELNLKYQIPKRIANEWVSADALILLLDGLDEVRIDLRDACVTAINNYRQEHGFVPIVVCSRSEDYALLEQQLQFQRALRLLPLQGTQIESYLDAGGEQLATLRTALAQDETLRELAQSPLMLSIMSLAYRDIPVQSVVSDELADNDARHTHLFDTYVTRMLQRRGTSQQYTPEQTTGWLAWLAQNMAKHSQSVFLLEQLQPSWLSRPRWRGSYLWPERFVEGLLVYGVLWAVLVVPLEPDQLNIDDFVFEPLYPVFVVIFLNWLIWRLTNRSVHSPSEFESSSFWQRRDWSFRLRGTELILGMLILFFFPTPWSDALAPVELPEMGIVGRILVGLLCGALLGVLLGALTGVVYAVRQPVMALRSAISTREGLNWSWRRFAPLFLALAIIPFGIAFAIANRSYQQIAENHALLRDGQTGAVLASLSGHGGQVHSSTFSPDGSVFITVRSEEAHLWRSTSGESIAMLSEHSSNINRVVFSPDSQSVVTISNGEGHLWNIQDGREKRFLADNTSQLINVVFSPASELMATISADAVVQIWEVDAGEELVQLPIRDGEQAEGFGHWIDRSGFNPSHSGLYTINRDNEIQLWDSETGEMIAELAGHSDDISAAAYSHNGRYLVTASDDKTARIWDGETGNLLAELEHDAAVTAVDISADSQRLLTTDGDEGIYLWDIGTGVPIARFSHAVAPIVSDIVGPKAQFSADGLLILTTGWDDSARLWDGETGEALQNLQIAEGTVTTAAFSGDGSRVVIESIVPDAVSLWNALTGSRISDLAGHSAAIDSARTASSVTAQRILTISELPDFRSEALLALVPGLLISVFLGLDIRIVESKRKPNQGLRLTARNGVLVGVLGTAVVGAILWLANFNFNIFDAYALAQRTGQYALLRYGTILELIASEITPFLIGYYLFLWFAGLDLMRHYLLRLTLIWADRTPRNYVRFLDFATERVFLQRIGGGYYIFIHRLLLEYFASRAQTEDSRY